MELYEAFPFFLAPKRILILQALPQVLSELVSRAALTGQGDLNVVDHVIEIFTIMVNGGTIKTEFGDITIQLYADDAPKTVENFKKLATSGFYDGLIFHRIVPGFVIQGGDPYTKDTSNKDKWGTGGPGWNVKAEFNKNTHSRGILSMARSQDPNSAGSQFFIVLKDSKSLDGKYTIFGKVTSGMDTVDKLAAIRTDPTDAPIDIEQAKMIKVAISN